MNDPVTIVVRRKVKPGRETDYEAWLERLTKGTAAQIKGYLGAEFHRPGPDGTYRSVFRFDGLESFDAFERSDFRAAMLAEGADLFAADAAWERMTGLSSGSIRRRARRLHNPAPTGWRWC